MRFLQDLTLNASAINSTMTTTMDDADRQRWKIVWIVTTSALIIFTVTGNAITLFAVCKMKSFQSSISNLYISSLAAADIVVGSFVMTFMMLYTIAYDGKWVFGRSLCDIWQAVDFISCTISLYSICAIGFDRWLNLEKPLRIFKRSKIVAKKAIFIVWTLPIMIWVPILLTIRLYNGSTPENQCYFPWKPKFLVPIVAVVAFYLPVFTLLVLFVRITSVIRSHFAFLHQHSNQNLLDLENRSNNNFRHSSFADRSPSVSPFPERRTISPAGVSFGRIPNPNGYHSPRRRSKPPKLSVIVQADDSSKGEKGADSGTKSKNGDGLTMDVPRQYFLQSPTTATYNSGNQSPLAMMLLRDRLSPTTRDEHNFVLPVSSPPTPENDKKSRRYCRRSTHTEVTPLLSPKMFDSTKKRSVSKDSMDEDKSDNSGSPVDPGDQKRSSVTSDTAVIFTKRYLQKKPPLVRARTDLVIEVSHVNERPPPRRGRFSVISLGASITNLSRRCSLNIFSELLPCPGSFSQQIRAAKAVGIIMIFFLVCWIPFLILWPLKAYCSDCVSDKWYALAIWANYVNSSVNPVLYTLCSPRFQNYFKGSCKCSCQCLPGPKDCTKSFLL